MNKKAISRILMIMFLSGFIIQAGVTAYSMIGTPNNSTSTNEISQENISDETVETIQTEDIVNTDISVEIQSLIRESDPNNFEKNIQNYKNLLTTLNVHTKFKEGIEELVIQGHKLPDIMIAYEYLYHSYGTFEDLKIFVSQKEKGVDWKQIFTTYRKNDIPFVPRSYDTDYLERLMKTPGITSDDIMIADRISYEANQELDELLNRKMEDENWKSINAELDILNSSSILPRVQVTSEDIQKYAVIGSFTDVQVVEAFVLSEKLNYNPETIISKIKTGYTEEAIQQEIYESKYY